MASRPYIYYSSTTSLCPECINRVEAKILIQDNKVFLEKICSEHGVMRHILEEDAEFFKTQDLYDKPGTLCKFQSKFNKGCPFDCGLCPHHEQHSCIGLIEVTSRCGLKCPVCYANSGQGKDLPLEKVNEMMDFFQETEDNKAELLQISGGEPTDHPDIIAIIESAMKKNFKHVMLNTNGLNLLTNENLVEKLKSYKKGFEVYLQFDGFEPDVYKKLRGRDLSKVKQEIVSKLSENGISTTLVTTLKRGLNDSEVGKIIDFGMKTKHVRGINFQPVSLVGRLPEEVEQNRITRTGVIKLIEEQTSGMIKKTDFIPLPCHPQRVAFTYLYNKDGEFVPITRGLNAQEYVPMIKNTFTFVPEDFVKNTVKELVGITNIGCDCVGLLKKLAPIIPKSYFLKSESQRRDYLAENTFRISITSFIDPYNFDMKSMRKECVHIITPDLKKIPFSSFNMIYRKKYHEQYYS